METKGAFHLVKISGISASAVNGTRFVGSSHWNIPRKSGNLKRWSRFPGWNFRAESRVPFTFLVVCTSSRSTVGHRHYRGLRPNGTTFYQSEIPLLLPPKFPGFFRKWKAPQKTKHFSLNFLSSKLEQMAEVFNCHGSSHGRIQFSCNVSNMHGTRRQTIKIKNGKKDRNNNRHSFDAQSLGQFKSLDQMPRFEYPLPPSPTPPRHITGTVDRIL